jgi:hypothetical protein
MISRHLDGKHGGSFDGPATVPVGGTGSTSPPGQGGDSGPRLPGRGAGGSGADAGLPSLRGTHALLATILGA